MKQTIKLDKCSKSPTGGHHWIIDSRGSECMGECKYCHKKMKFYNSFPGGNSINPLVSKNKV